MTGEELTTITTRIPRSVAVLLDKAKVLQGRTKEEIIREGIVWSVLSRNPPPQE